ncbi:thioredoxin-like protein [Decorospora gaudefroyi]|uniref:Glutathione S-transferase kappa 1 n=1 Tax=Decorospora gaudefroyi TaxID=184978 RepID=A0A6A5KBH4_9PLEO|nr:thioredoxin-like protein [Decorospora gaudefroyi]
MSSKITCYLDCVSPYSYFALLYLERNRDILEAHDVEIDIVPVFLGGINVGSGNKPPWTLEAKAHYSKYDSARAKRYFGVPNIQTPSFFPILSLLPQRALGFVKEAHREQFISVFLDIYQAMWENGKDVSKPEVLAEVLGQRLKPDEARQVMEQASSAPYKQRLNDNTREALDRGAFGCPWYWVRNSKGEEEPFFGSDRYVPSPHTFLPRPLPCSYIGFAAEEEGWFATGRSVSRLAAVAERGARLRGRWEKRTMKHGERSSRDVRHANRLSTSQVPLHVGVSRLTMEGRCAAAAG